MIANKANSGVNRKRNSIFIHLGYAYMGPDILGSGYASQLLPELLKCLFICRFYGVHFHDWLFLFHVGGVLSTHWGANTPGDALYTHISSL